LTIASQRHRTIRGGQRGRDKTDRDRIIDYFKFHAASVRAAVQLKIVEMRRLAERRGRGGGTVVDGPIQEHCRRFKGAVLGTSTCTDEPLAEATAEILNKVRNNLFHGNKIYDETDDRELLNLVTPLLMTIVATCERLELPGPRGFSDLQKQPKASLRSITAR
jgi:hypothetical protein